MLSGELPPKTVSPVSLTSSVSVQCLQGLELEVVTGRSITIRLGRTKCPSALSKPRFSSKPAQLERCDRYPAPHGFRLPALGLRGVSVVLPEIQARG